MGAVDFSHTGCFSGVLKTLTAPTGHHPVCPGARGIESGRGYELVKTLLAILYLSKRAKVELRACLKSLFWTNDIE
jgi:hypothetical protein